MQIATIAAGMEPVSTEVELLRATLDLMPCGVAVLGPDSTVLTSNARFYDMLSRAGVLVPVSAGYTRQQLITGRLSECAPALSAMPEELMGPSGSKFQLSYTHGKPHTGCMTIIVRDVTVEHMSSGALSAALEQKQMIEQAKTAFVSQVAHHFRTPLNVILGYCDILSGQGSQVDQVTQTSYLQFISESAAALLLNMNEMMDIIRLQRNEQIVEMETRELRRLFNGPIAEIESILWKESVTLDPEKMFQTIGRTTVRMDARLARRAVTSLLRTCAVLGGEGSTLVLAANPLPAAGQMQVTLEFDAGRTDAKSVVDSVMTGEPVKEISLTGNASGYGVVLAAVLLRLSEVDIVATATGERHVCITMVFQQADR